MPYSIIVTEGLLCQRLYCIELSVAFYWKSVADLQLQYGYTMYT